MLTFPFLVLLATVNPEGILLHKLLLSPSLFLGMVWAVFCLWAGLSSERLSRYLSMSSLMSSYQAGLLCLLGIFNCIAMVGLLWFAATLHY
jgi:hypothetical protein